MRFCISMLLALMSYCAGAGTVLVAASMEAGYAQPGDGVLIVVFAGVLVFCAVFQATLTNKEKVPS